jgi:hypothetical protein
MLVVHADDSLARLQRKAMEDLSRAVKAERVAKGAPKGIREGFERRVLDAEAVCSEHGALGKEC